jgi:hypothetical protein
MEHEQRKDMSELQRSVLKIMVQWYELWRGYDCLIDELKIDYGLTATKSELQSTMKELREIGLVRHMPATDGDGIPSGSGWFIKNMSEAIIIAKAEGA